VLEVGPGLGVVTEELVASVRRVVAVEKDRALAEHLRARLGGCRNLELIHADMLDLDAAALVRSGLGKVVSALPYSAGTRILVNLVKAHPAPQSMVVMLQTEVAARLAAEPGQKAYGLLSVTVQMAYGVKLVRRVSPTCFWPAPEVGSTMVRLDRLAGPPLTPAQEDALDGLTHGAFEHRRKQMKAIPDFLARRRGHVAAAWEAALREAGIAPESRPEEIPVDGWRRLACAVAAATGIDTDGSAA
jgi:16S rRNA (adenine1518-N6/adenine1519-N6)-dimethyltransferase